MLRARSRGTVRRVFSSSGAPAYAYDLYGPALQAPAPATDLTHAGLFHEVGSGVDSTLARANGRQAGTVRHRRRLVSVQ